jgi:S-adenosylmethionine synthetase
MQDFEVSEGIARGHPDKIADQIADAILDAYLLQDPASRVAVEIMVSHDLVAIGGEISSSARVNAPDIARSVVASVGYNSKEFGDLSTRLRIVSSLCEQSPDISQSVGKRGDGSAVAAGDQGIMTGFACNATPTFMPRSYEIARTIVGEIQKLRATAQGAFLGPDGKTQVAIDRSSHEARNGSVVLSWHHSATATLEDVRSALLPIVQEVSEQYQFRPDPILINPSGRFVLGGPLADTGLTGRKQMADSYGSSVVHGGGSYSGKDATKVDRSGAYMARYVAKHIVAAQLATVCEIQLVFAIGKPTPLHIGINCYGTETVRLEILKKAVEQTFDFSVGGIIRELHLTTPLFQQTSYGGHFGRDEFPWEHLPHRETLLHHVASISSV